MPRPRAKDPLQPLLEPIARRFAAQVAAAVVSFVEARVKREVETAVDRAFASARARGAAPARKRRIRPCRVPGCGQPSRGPRFDFFCAEHRDLPAAEKAAIKAGKRANGGRPDPKPRKTAAARRGKATADAAAE